MANILITAGPTREFLDPVRYLSNASSGRMAQALTEALLNLGHQVTVVSGPVSIRYPDAATVIPVVSTQEMLDASLAHLQQADGVIAVAAPCDFRPHAVAPHKIKKVEQQDLTLQLTPTPDILAALTESRPEAWYIGFALETENGLQYAVEKKHRKRCNWILLNQATAIGSTDTRIQIIDHHDQPKGILSGSKHEVARQIANEIQQHFLDRH